MRILHYYLGPAPLRSGGLTKYAQDLIKAEKLAGDVCYELYPVGLALRKKMTIKRDSSRSNAFLLMNAYPLPLNGGIQNPDDFHGGHVDLDNFRSFLSDLKVDVLHVHTLMGLPKELLILAHEAQVKLIFTSHDYYGLSPVPDFFDNIKKESFAYAGDEQQLLMWQRISGVSQSTLKLRVFQLKHYEIFKRILRKIASFKKEREYSKIKEVVNDLPDIKKFSDLRQYYQSLLMMMDVLHFNSNVAKDVYVKNLPRSKEQRRVVIPITNLSIDKRVKLRNHVERGGNRLQLGYLGRFTAAKGVFDLVKAFSKANNPHLELRLYGDTTSHVFNVVNVQNMGTYGYGQLDQVLESLDLVIIPSEWEETFGFVVLECVTHGIPVIFSKKVGAGMLFDDSYVGKYCSINELVDKLKDLDSQFLRQLYQGMQISIPEILDVKKSYML